MHGRFWNTSGTIIIFSSSLKSYWQSYFWIGKSHIDWYVIALLVKWLKWPVVSFIQTQRGFLFLLWQDMGTPGRGGLIEQNGKFCLPVQLVNIANSAKDSAQTSKFRLILKLIFPLLRLTVCNYFDFCFRTFYRKALCWKTFWSPKWVIFEKESTVFCFTYPFKSNSKDLHHR